MDQLAQRTSGPLRSSVEAAEPAWSDLAAPSSSTPETDLDKPEPLPATEAVSTGRSEAETRAGIDKSQLPISEPRRYRNKEHLRFVSKQACLICGRKHSDPHHLGFMQPRALGRKVSDEFVVPLCRIHHRAVHRVSDEQAWWAQVRIDAAAVARKLWTITRLDEGSASTGAKKETTDQNDAFDAGDDVPGATA